MRFILGASLSGRPTASVAGHRHRSPVVAGSADGGGAPMRSSVEGSGFSNMRAGWEHSHPARCHITVGDGGFGW